MSAWESLQDRWKQETDIDWTPKDTKSETRELVNSYWPPPVNRDVGLIG